MWFASDNTSGGAPEVLDAVARASAGHAASYGADDAMARVTARVREVFEAPEAAVCLVPTGTAANALSLACLCRPFATVYCHRNAHVEEDECGAPEFYTGGAKLTLLEGAHAKIAPESFEQALASTALVGVHNVQKGALTLTNPTEQGAAYTPVEVAALATTAHAEGLPVHMDGARFANALVHLGCTPSELTWKAGVDVLSFGGTKNGCLGVEAVVLFDPARAWELELRRKRGGHLLSKHRFLSAQMEAYLADDLWLRLAKRSNARAADLARGIAAIPGARILHPVEANMVFAAWPRSGHRAARAAGARYYFWPGDQCLDGRGDQPLAARLVCGWSTTADEVAALLGVLQGQEAAERA